MDNLQLSQGGNFALSSGALAAGTNAGTVQNASVIAYTVDGAHYSKAATNNVAPTVNVPAVASNGYATNGAFTGQVGGSTRLIGIYLDAAGAYSFVPGPVVVTADLAAGQAPLQFPAPIKGRTCVGVLRVAVTAGTTFIPGTTALNAAGVTTSFLNLFAIPGEPLKA